MKSDAIAMMCTKRLTPQEYLLRQIDGAVITHRLGLCQRQIKVWDTGYALPGLNRSCKLGQLPICCHEPQEDENSKEGRESLAPPALRIFSFIALASIYEES